MNPLRDYQIQACNDIEAAAAAGHRGIVLQAVTGAGKTRMMIELMQRNMRRQQQAAVYTNRRMLLHQLHEVFDFHGVQHGQRAAGRQKQLSRNVQLCMMQTERRKVLQSQERQLHAAELVIVDEAHINAQGGALEIIKRHQDAGATVVLFSATPVGLGHVATTIIHGCSSSQARLAGATLPARCYAIEEPSKNLVRRVATGEEEIAGKMRRQYCQMIVGRVEQEWRRLNPQGLPTILFGPDVASSQWLADSLWKRGIDACHIDAKGIYADGRRQDGEQAKERLIKEFKDCERQIICNRFVMREGLDITCIYHAILATRFGSETSYLQAIGRALRNDPSLPGACYLRRSWGQHMGLPITQH